MSIRPDLHTSEGLATYVRGMQASMQEKAKFLPYVRPGRILEVGCGNGTVLQLLAGAFPESELVGVDFSAKLLGLAAAQEYNENRTAVTLHRADVFRLDPADLGGEGTFDTVVFCSVLHELYSVRLGSYSAPPQTTMTSAELPSEAGRAAVADVLRLSRRLLKPGGRVVIRDGVQPVRRRLRVAFRSDEVREKFYRFADDFAPFPLRFSVDAATDTVLIDSVHLYEFATKYFYDQNWAVEVREQFGWTTLDGLGDLLRETGFAPVEVTAYAIPFLREKWERDLDVRSIEGGPTALETTMIAAGEAV
jgi:SAM-dependent methyltransferase